MNDELIPLPCPFCGSKNITIEKSSHSKFPNVMACINCWAQSSYEDTPQEAIKAWNTRVESTLEKKLEEANQSIFGLNEIIKIKSDETLRLQLKLEEAVNALTEAAEAICDAYREGYDRDNFSLSNANKDHDKAIAALYKIRDERSKTKP